MEKQKQVRKRNAIVAHHEAGHAVAAVALSIRFSFVWIAGREGRLEPARDCDGRVVVWKNDFGDAVMTAAGGVAEARKSKKSFFSIYISSAKEDFRHITKNGHDARAAVAHAKQIVSDYWAAIEAVAEKLMISTILSEDEVLELVERTSKTGG